MSYEGKQTGFTLVEMIVALAVFAVVATVSIGALLMLIGTNDQIQSKQSVITNLSFALDSMTRELRTGTSYFCDGGSNRNASMGGGPGRQIFRDGEDNSPMGNAARDCPNGRDDDIQGIAFIESGQSITGVPDTRIVYFYDNRPVVDGGQMIYRRISGGDAEPLISSNILITDAEFYVTGSLPLQGSDSDEVQATVTIFIEAIEVNRLGEEPYQIQTTITQRTLDI